MYIKDALKADVRRVRRGIRERLNPYNPAKYWRDAGPITPTPAYLEQARNILAILERLEFRSVYEVGVGEGRIAAAVLESRSVDEYNGCDMTPCRTERAIARLGSHREFSVECTPFQRAALGTYDLVLAVSCLMHVKPNELEPVMRKMRDHSLKYVVNVDYWEPKRPPYLAPHNFLHHYGEVYESLGMECERVALPHGQSCFVATAA